MPSTSTVPESPPRPPRAPSHLPTVVAVVAACGLLLAQVAALLALPDRVDRITIHNATDYHLDLRLRDSPDGSRLLLGPVARNSTKTIRAVIDPGDTFVIEGSYGGIEVDALTFHRAALEQDDWEITIPAGVADPLRADGLVPPPG